jgi:ABC-type antimicrobial peptide transport system permease subunit
VVGVSRNAVSGWIGTGLERPVVFYPLSADSSNTQIVARVTGDASQARDRIDRAIAAVDQGAVIEIHTLDDYLAVQRWPFKIFSLVSSAIGAIALLLTLIGIYGVLSYLVAQRAKEVGIRMALGASVGGVVGQVLRQSLRYALVGLAAGSVLALGVSKLFASVLVIVDTFDPAGYAFGAAVVLAACLVAAWAPSRRAARVNPLDALRQE